MEKFSRWDDPSNGLNPFVPLKPKGTPPNFIIRFLRSSLSAILLFIRIPCIIVTIIVGISIHTFKYLLIIPILVRFWQLFTNMMVGKMLMSVTSFNAVEEKYHREEKNFDFCEYQKGHLLVKHVEGDVLVCNQTCFVDWLFLNLSYSPIFTKIVIVQIKEGYKIGLRPLSTFEMITHGLGINFPETV